MSIIEASVVDLPLPVVPVIRTIPRSSKAKVRITSGRPSVSNSGISKGMKRIAMETAPRCLKALTLNRPSSVS